MRRILASQVQAEISAKNYKALVARLKGFSKKKLWEILDHYLFHIMQDQHCVELMQILDQLDGSKHVPVDPPKVVTPTLAAASAEGFSLPTEEAEDSYVGRYSYASILNDQEMVANKTRLALMYDVTYFTYLDPKVVAVNAKALVDFAEKSNLPASAHWHLFARQPEILALLLDGEDEE